MKKEYQAPLLSVCRIEMESGFCSASSEVTNPDTDSGRIDEHKTNTDFSGDFSSGSWDSDPTL
ncbi:MAG: hypothetical protein ACI3Z0_06900, partial [Candidatus Cryptobacteroides sp.]